MTTGIFIVNFESIFRLALVFILVHDFEHVNAGWVPSFLDNNYTY